MEMLLGMFPYVVTGVQWCTIVAVVYVVGGMALGVIWDLCTRPRDRAAGSAAHGSSAVPLAKRLRLDSWFGRLLRTAYGEDRMWFARWAAWWRFRGSPTSPAEWAIAVQYPGEFTVRVPSSIDTYRNECFRLLVALLDPPHLQPWVRDAPKISICPLFHRVIVAGWIYVPSVFLRWMLNSIIVGIRLAIGKIADAYRAIGERFGVPLRRDFVIITMVSLVFAGMFARVGMEERATRSMGEAAERVALEQHQRRIHAQWMAQQQASDRAERRRVDEEAARIAAFQQPFVERFAAQCGQFFRHHPLQPIACAEEWTSQLSHAAHAARCAYSQMPYTDYIALVSRGDVRGAKDRDLADECWSEPKQPRDPRWEYEDDEDVAGYAYRTDVPRRHTKAEVRRYEEQEADYRAYLAAVTPDFDRFNRTMAERLRVLFADELRNEAATRDRAIAAAEEKDSTVLAAATAELAPLRAHPQRLYETLTARCRREAFFSPWTRATCESLMGIVFAEDIAASERSAEWRRLGRSLLVNLTDLGTVAIIPVGLLLAGALLTWGWIALWDHWIVPRAESFSRTLRATGKFLKWLTVPFWGPFWVLGRGIVWATHRIVAVWKRSGFVAFRAAVIAIFRDTIALVGARAHAAKHRLCWFVDWQWPANSDDHIG